MTGVWFIGCEKKRKLNDDSLRWKKTRGCWCALDISIPGVCVDCSLFALSLSEPFVSCIVRVMLMLNKPASRPSLNNGLKEAEKDCCVSERMVFSVFWQNRSEDTMICPCRARLVNNSLMCFKQASLEKYNELLHGPVFFPTGSSVFLNIKQCSSTSSCFWSNSSVFPCLFKQFDLCNTARLNDITSESEILY